MAVNEPYGTDSRLGSLEREQARSGQRMSDLERRVDALTPLLTSVVTLTAEFQHVRDDLKSVREDLHIFVRAAEERDRDAARDRLAYKRWMIGLGVALFCALIGAAAVIISAHP